MKYLTPFIIGAVLSVSGCYEMPAADEPAPQRVADIETPIAADPMPVPKPEPKASTTKQVEIDWDSARSDFAKRAPTDTGMVSIASGGDAPAVPVLLPDMRASVASAGGADVQFRPTADGYFAVIPGESYDMIINGTDRLIPTSDAGPTDTELRFEETMTGAQVAFARYGASYLVQFACKGDAAVMGGCIGEDDALAAVQALLIAGTR
jgi:hypothetical protein